MYDCTHKSINYLHDKSFHPNPNDRRLSKLINLHLDGNNISILHDDQFSKLLLIENINMGNNKLTLISGSIFSKNIYLKNIDLSDNNIVNFNFRLDVLESLIYLGLGRNKLSTLNERVFSYWFATNNTYASLDISHNEFKCDCSMSWILDLANINIQIVSNLIDLCSANMSRNLTLGCFMRQEIGVQCGKVNVEQCIKGKLFTYIIIVYIFYLMES